ncbi:hypothetical protein J4Q44_G00287820 [Coregonus suidteri]|uniref:Uncharacterized protein n=1 Tax=Coregonus suidteri TaxID=861788 RepID=A0AAN8KTC2_9TELE
MCHVLPYLFYCRVLWVNKSTDRARWFSCCVVLQDPDRPSQTSLDWLIRAVDNPSSRRTRGLTSIIREY